MVKLRVEICILSAHGLGHSSSLWKPQWFAVGWIDPNDKYCTKIDDSGSPNRSWKTRLSVSIDTADPNLQGLSLSVDVYRMEPIFLREKLQGTATIMLEEFFARFERDEAWIEETASFQLRKRNSGNAKGFVNVSVRVFEERPGDLSHSGFGEALSSPSNEIPLAIEDGPAISYPTRYMNPAGSSKEFRRPATPPPPSPPSNTGLLPSPFLAGRPSHGTRDPGFASGLGAGALAAGAVIFGDDFLDSLNVSTDPPF